MTRIKFLCSFDCFFLSRQHITCPVRITPSDGVISFGSSFNIQLIFVSHLSTSSDEFITIRLADRGHVLGTNEAPFSRAPQILVFPDLRLLALGGLARQILGRILRTDKMQLA
jgi:hypothetical protein